MGERGDNMSNAFSSGFATGYGITSDWKRRKEAKAKIDKATEEMTFNSMELAKGYDKDRADGVITEQEYGDRISWAITISNEMMNNVQTLYTNSRNMSKEQLDKELVELDSLYNIYAATDYQDLTEIKERVNGFKFEKARNQGNFYIDILKNRQPKQEEPEYFPNLPALKAKYGEKAEGTFASGKGFVYTGEEQKIQPKSSDYINLVNVLGALAESKTDEEFQAFKSNMEAETGINLGDISRKAFIGVDPEEIKYAGFDDVFFGTRGIMNEYVESGKDLDEEISDELRSKWMLVRPLMSAADQQRGDAYFASIGIDLNPPVKTPIPEPEPKQGFWGSRVEDVKTGAKGLSDWIDKWIEPEQFPKKY